MIVELRVRDLKLNDSGSTYNQGGGTLTLTADPNNSVPYKIISGYELVR